MPTRHRLWTDAVLTRPASQALRNAVLFCLLAAGLVVVLCFRSTPAWAEPVRQEFKDWLAIIEESEEAYCRPQGFLYSNRKVPDFQVRVIRRGQASGCRITLFSAFQFVDLNREMRVRVDGNPGIRLDGIISREEVKTIQIYTVTEDAAVKRLLRRMRAGAWIRFDYTDLMGQQSSTAFSLMGVSAALDAVGCGKAGR
ncbi:MAG: hypothetical protein K9L59_08075 [Desulfobacterales bacterium]|nr:hypothetical protein [Desulfobacterales bacterium]